MLFRADALLFALSIEQTFELRSKLNRAEELTIFAPIDEAWKRRHGNAPEGHDLSSSDALGLYAIPEYLDFNELYRRAGEDGSEEFATLSTCGMLRLFRKEGVNVTVMGPARHVTVVARRQEQVNRVARIAVYPIDELLLLPSACGR